MDPTLENEEHTIGPTFDTAELEISLLSRKRYLVMRKIVLHNQCNSPWHSVLKGLMGTILGLYHWSNHSFKKNFVSGFCLVVTGFVIWPSSNILLLPNAWYECMLQCGILWCGKKLLIVCWCPYDTLLCRCLLCLFTGKHCRMDRVEVYIQMEILLSHLPHRISHHDELLVLLLYLLD